MSRVQFLSYKGKKILYFDLSNCKIAELAAVVAEAKKAVSSQPQASVLALTNVTETELSKDSSAIIKDFTAHNKPYIKASAVVGVEGPCEKSSITPRWHSVEDTSPRSTRWTRQRTGWPRNSRKGAVTPRGASP
jgi:hypothetical protein